MALITNRKARFDYEIGETFEAGMELLGFEVKSLRQGKGALEGSFVIIRGGEAFLVGSHIPPYQSNNAPTDYDPDRNRRLLLNKKELRQLELEEKKAGLTIVPLSVYNKGKKIKLEIAVARGKKRFDKRESIKKRESDRDIRRSLK